MACYPNSLCSPDSIPESFTLPPSLYFQPSVTIFLGTLEQQPSLRICIHTSLPLQQLHIQNKRKLMSIKTIKPQSISMDTRQKWHVFMQLQESSKLWQAWFHSSTLSSKKHPRFLFSIFQPIVNSFWCKQKTTYIYPCCFPSPGLPCAYSFPSSCSPPSSMVPCLCNLFFMLPQVLLHLSTRNVTAELGIICLIKEEEGCWLL